VTEKGAEYSGSGGRVFGIRGFLKRDFVDESIIRY
jgi:hypothetical protein